MESSGSGMPLVGLGIGSLTPTPREMLVEAIETALDEGYRLFDTAYVYQNEDVLGQVLEKWIRDGKGTREQLFIVTKLPPIGMEKSRVKYFLDLSLAALQLTYVDLYLVHFPVGCIYNGDDSKPFPFDPDTQNFVIDPSTSLEQVWEGMEQVKVAGKAKAIGLSNFNKSQIQRILKSGTILPSAIQIEANAYFQQKDLRKFCEANNIRVCAYAPLGSPGRRSMLLNSGAQIEIASILEDPTVTGIAEAKKKLPAQILLRMLTQRGITAIPNSVNLNRIKQNFESLDFDLSEEELERLESIDKGEEGRMFDLRSFTGFENHPEFPYK